MRKCPNCDQALEERTRTEFEPARDAELFAALGPVPHTGFIPQSRQKVKYITEYHCSGCGYYRQELAGQASSQNL